MSPDCGASCGVQQDALEGLPRQVQAPPGGDLRRTPWRPARLRPAATRAREATTHGYAPRGTREASSRRATREASMAGRALRTMRREREGESGGSSYICAVYYVIP